MAYVKQTWINDDPNSQLSAERLNYIETGIYNSAEGIDNINSDIALLIKSFDGDLAQATAPNNFKFLWNSYNKKLQLFLGSGVNDQNDIPKISRSIEVLLTGIASSSDVEALQQSKQDKLTIDSTPTLDSTNPVSSGGVYLSIQSTVHDVKVNGLSIVHDNVAELTLPTRLSDLEDDLDYTRLKVKHSGDDISDIRTNDFIFETEG